MPSIRILLIILLLIAFPNYVLSQSKTVIVDETNRLIMAYTYYIAQKASLESVAERFPELKEPAINASAEWSKEFNSSISRIDSSLQIIKGKDWENEKLKIYEKYRRADHSNVSEKEARQFVEITFQRSFGKIQSPVLETLLVFKPEYINSPEKEFSDGYVNNYFSANPKKKADLNVRIVYPRSWKAVQGSTQNNIQQVFISNFGTGRLALSFLSERTANLPMEKIPSLLTENSLKRFCLKTDSIVEFMPGLDLDFCSAARLSYIRKEVDFDKKYTILYETYHSYYKNNHFALVFTYRMDYTNYESIKAEFEKYRKLIRKILFNIVIMSQWEQKRF